MANIGNLRTVAETFMLISISADFRVVIKCHRRAEAEYHVISEFYQRGYELRQEFFSQCCEFCLISAICAEKVKQAKIFMM